MTNRRREDASNSPAGEISFGRRLIGKRRCGPVRVGDRDPLVVIFAELDRMVLVPPRYVMARRADAEIGQPLGGGGKSVFFGSTDQVGIEGEHSAAAAMLVVVPLACPGSLDLGTKASLLPKSNFVAARAFRNLSARLVHDM